MKNYINQIGLFFVLLCCGINQASAISLTGIGKALLGISERTTNNAIHDSDNIAREAIRESESVVTDGDRVIAHEIKKELKEEAKDKAKEFIDKSILESKNNEYKNNFMDSDASLIKMAKEHFLEDKKCNINKVIGFYNEIIFYDNKKTNIQELIKLKEDACRRFSAGISLDIKNDYVEVSDFENEPNLKVLVYDVEFEFYSTKKQKNVSGTTRVAIVATVDTQKIVGEVHRKISP